MEAGTAKVRAILSAASSTDSTLNGVLTNAKEGNYAPSGNPTLAQAAKGAKEKVPGTVNVPPPPKGASQGDYAAWYASLTKDQQAQVRGNKDVMQQISDAKLHVTGSDDNSSLAADPVHTGSGNFVETEHDLDFSGNLAGLGWARTYNSRSTVADGGFGARWNSPVQVLMLGREGGVSLTLPDGREVFIPRQGRGFGRAQDFPVVVSSSPRDEFVLTFNDGQVWEFDLYGQLAATSQGPGTRVEYGYEQANGSRRLVNLRHVDTGVSLDVRWDGSRVAAVDCNDGRRVEYVYDESLRLVRALGSAAVTREYRYDAAGYLFEVVDADGVVEVSNTYDDRGRVLSQVSPTGNITDFVYLPDQTTVVEQRGTGVSNVWYSDKFGRCTGITDGNGETHRIEYDTVGNPIRYISRSGSVTDQWFDQLSRLVKRRVADGSQVLYTWDGQNRLTSISQPHREDDPSVGVTHFEYEGQLRLPSRVTDPTGGVTRFEMNRHGLVERATDADGVVSRLQWDELGRLASVTDAAGSVTRWEYDTAGSPVRLVEPSGAVTAFGYDTAGRLVRRTEPDGAQWWFEYSAAGRLVASEDPSGARTVTAYGASGLMESNLFADATSQSYRWDGFGNLVGLTAADYSTWSWEYDAVQRLTTRTDALGSCWSAVFDVDGNLVAETDPTGRGLRVTRDVMGRASRVDDGVSATEYVHGAAGDVVSSTAADGSRVQVERDSAGRAVAVTDASGGVTVYTRTPAGRVASIRTPGGRVESYTYDAAGRVDSITDAVGAVSRVTYTPDGLVSARVWPDGSRDTFDYDVCGRVVAVHAAASGSTYYTYDACGRTVGISDAGFGSRRFAYDEVGNLVEAIDGNGGVTRYEFDQVGRVVAMVDPMGGRTTWEYDAAGRAVAQTDPLGRTMRTEHDAAGRKTAHTVADGTRLEWSYDSAGAVSGMTTTGPDGSVERYRVSVDRASRTVRWESTESGSVTVRVDSAGNMVSRVRMMPGGDTVELGWEYDADGYRTSFTHDDGSVTEYTLDGRGLVTGLTHPRVGAATMSRDSSGRVIELHAPGVTASWEYGPAGVTHHTVTRSGITATTRVGRDAAGRVVRLVESTSTGGLTTTSYVYDGAGQLMSWSDGSGTTRLTYDAAGRLVRETRTVGDALVGTRSYVYDAAGQLVSVTAPDAAGVVRRREYAYDALGHRVAEKAAGGEAKTYSYDARGFLRSTTTMVGDEMPAVRSMEIDALGELARVDDEVVVFDSADPWAPLARLGSSLVVGSGVATAEAGSFGSGWVTPDWRGLPATVTDPFGAVIPHRGGEALAGSGSGSSTPGQMLSGSATSSTAGGGAGLDGLGTAGRTCLMTVWVWRMGANSVLTGCRGCGCGCTTLRYGDSPRLIRGRR